MVSPESLALLRRAMPPFPVNLAALVGAEAAINDRGAMHRYARNIKVVRTWFAKELSKLSVKTYPSAGNFILANFGAGGPELFRRLERRGILLRERTKEIGPGFVRITIGTRSEMDRLLKEIKRNG